MKNEEKQLLIKDLCARLPYGVMCNIQTRFVFEDGTLRRGSYDKILDLDTVTTINEWKETGELEKLKPYLRPMESMTENEENELSKILNYEFYVDDDCALVAEDDRHRISLDLMQIYIDWLNEHHFDYRELIDKGLALEAPEGMYNIK